MFASYFDASGHSEDPKCPYVVVAGFIGNLNQWKMVEDVWPSKLREHRIYWPFHMADFMASRDDFEQWDGDEDEKNAVLDDLTVIEHVFPVATISCVINLSEYSRVNAVFELKEKLPPYALGARTCMEQLRDWVRYHQITTPIECVFEDGDFGKGKFMDVMRQDGLPAPIFKQKKDFAALQAADHLAWEQFFYLREKLNIGQAPQMRLHLLYQRALPHILVHYPLESLLRLCDVLNIPRRPMKTISGV